MHICLFGVVFKAKLLLSNEEITYTPTHTHAHMHTPTHMFTEQYLKLFVLETKKSRINVRKLEQTSLGPQKCSFGAMSIKEKEVENHF